MRADWRKSETLDDLTTAEALMVLGQITEALASRQTQTVDTQDYSRLDLMAASPEGQELRDAALKFHRRARAAEDCRPTLRQTADERRELTPEEVADDFASQARAFHRK